MAHVVENWQVSAGAGGVAACLHPWQTPSLESGLILHAPATLPDDVVLDVGRLQAEYASLNAAVPHDRRNMLAGDGSWAAMTLVDRPLLSHAASGSGKRRWELDFMPSVAVLLDRMPWQVLGCYVIRQQPHGVLPWHFDRQAIHLAECRLLLPIHAPVGAETLIGYQSVAYPEGTLWTGDFSFPHQVNNPTDRERIVVAIDVTADDAVRALFPPALAAARSLRFALSQDACNALNAYRSSN